MIVGLDNAGKTTILNHLKKDRDVVSTVAEHTIPTIGYNVETIQYKQVSFTLYDCGGQQKVRHLWRQFYQDANCVIFVVDLNDKDRIEEAREELHNMMSDELLKNASLLVYANKSDLPNAISENELCSALRLREMTGRTWFVQKSVATTGLGIFDGLEWINRALN
jgi:small GTP-binding protein